MTTPLPFSDPVRINQIGAGLERTLTPDAEASRRIARALDLSLHTVKRHVANILTKLAVDSRTQAAAYWHRR